MRVSEANTAICGGVPCAGGATPDQITGLELGITVQRGNPSVGCQDTPVPSGVQGCLTAAAPLDLGLPGLSLKALPGETIAARLGFRIHLRFGVDTDDGFYVRTNDDDKPELQGNGIDRRYLSDPPGDLLKAQGGRRLKASADPAPMGDPDSPAAYLRQQQSRQ